MSFQPFQRIPDRYIGRVYRGLDPRWIPLYITLLFLVIFATSVASLLLGATLFGVTDTQLTLSSIIDVLFTRKTATIVGYTILIGVGSGLIATTMGFCYAWIIVRTNIPGKKFLRIIVVLPLAMPFIVRGIGWISILSPQFGALNQFTQDFLGFTLMNIYSVHGIIIAMGTGGLPLTFLILEPAIRSLDSSLEESSRVGGRGVLGTLRYVTIPLLFPAIFSAFMLSTIFGIGNFDYPFLLGAATIGIDTLATEIYRVMMGVVPRYELATIYSIIYVFVAFGAITIYWYTTRKSFKYETVGGKSSRQTVHDLGRWKWAGTGACLGLWGIAFLPPFLGMFFMSFSPSIATVYGASFTLDNYITLFSIPAVYMVIYNTVVISLAAGLLVALFATFISYASVKYDRFTGIGDYVSTVPLGFPPIVYGLAIFWMLLIIPYTSSLYGTLAPMVLALVFTRIPHGVRMITSNLIQISDEMEEASRSGGASWATGFRKITVPLMRGGISNAFLYTFIGSMRELGAIVLLISAGNNVFTGLLLQMYNQDASALPIVAAGSMILFLIVLVFVLSYELLGFGRYGTETY